MATQFPNYTANVPSMLNNSWRSNSNFTYSLLSGVYDQAEKNLDSIFENYQELKSCKLNKEDILDFSYCEYETDVNAIIDDNLGPMVYSGIWLSLGLIFTIIGIIWCLCNKCCCCCMRRDPLDGLENTDPEFRDNRRDLDGPEFSGLRKKRLISQIIVGSFMTLWIIGFSFSMFIAFASNENIRKSIREIPDDINGPLEDAETFLNTTKNQINSIFVTSYGNLSKKIEEIAARSSRLAAGNFENVNRLSRATTQLLSTIEEFENHVDDQLAVQFTVISDALKSLNATVEEKVVPLYQNIEGQKSRAIPGILDAIIETGKELQGYAKSMNDALDEVPLEDARDRIQEAEDDYLDIVATSVYGSLMGFTIVLLFMLIGVVIGSAVIWVGKGNTRKTGFIFYRFSITAMFVTGWIVLCVMLTQFAGAGFFSQFFCEAIIDLENDGTDSATLTSTTTTRSVNVRNAYQIGNNNTVYEVPNYDHVVSSCKNGESAYKAFQLKQVYDIESIRNISDNFITSLRSTFDTDEFFIKHVDSVYSSLEKHLISLQTLENETESMVDPDPFFPVDGFKQAYSKVQYELISLLNDIKLLESGNGLRSTKQQDQIDEVIRQVNHFEDFVYEQINENVGECEPLYLALNATIHTFCYKVLAPVATFWWALQFLLCIFVTVIITALVSERVFK